MTARLSLHFTLSSVVGALTWSCGGMTHDAGVDTDRNTVGPQSGGSLGNGSTSSLAKVEAYVLEPRCTLPLKQGTCTGLSLVFWHDPATGRCMPFAYGGCDGNDNQFASKEQCEVVCKPRLALFASCNLDRDCVLATPSCCSACADVRGGDLIPVSITHRHELPPTCSVPCGGCDFPPEASVEQLKDFRAACVNRRCTRVER